MVTNSLGEFLRARRDRICPGDVGLAVTGVRRVPGLRREEVASLVGLSVDYYSRLEQGREKHPSTSVLTALGRVLRLEPDAQRHLFALANPGPVTRPPGQRVSQHLLELLAEWPNHPALLLSRCHTVVGANQLGAALYAGHRHSDNLARLLFLDPDGRTFYREWDKVAASSVASMRASATHDPHDTDLLALVGELSVRSPEFSRWWSKGEVREKTSDVFRARHPLVGDLDLTFEAMRPTGAPDLMLKIYRAVPGTGTAEALALLGSLTADDPTRPTEPAAPSQPPSSSRPGR